MFHCLFSFKQSTAGETLSSVFEQSPNCLKRRTPKKMLAQSFRDGNIGENSNNGLFRWLKFNFEIREPLRHEESSL